MPASRPPDARPQFILIVTGVFCLFGVMCFVGALQLMGSGDIHAGGALIERYPEAVACSKPCPPDRLITMISGALEDTTS